jgi:hypothetical protein
MPNDNASIAIKDLMLAQIMSDHCGDDGEGSTTSIDEDRKIVKMRYLPETGVDGDVDLRMIIVEKGANAVADYLHNGDMLGAAAAGPTGVLTVWRIQDGGYRGNVRRCGTVVRKCRTRDFDKIGEWVESVWPLLNLDAKCTSYDLALFRNLPNTDLAPRRGAIVASPEEALDMLQIYPTVVIPNHDGRGGGVMLWMTEVDYIAAKVESDITEMTHAPEIEGLREATNRYWLAVRPAQGNA